MWFLFKPYVIVTLDNFFRMNSLTENDSILWSRIKRGSIEALSELYYLHADLLYDYGTKLTKDDTIVMDCIHDLFLDLYKYRKKLCNSVNIKYYLLKSLKRKIVGQNRTNLVLISPEEDFSGKYYKDLQNTIEEQIIQSENEVDLKSSLLGALKTLTNKQRAMIVMRFNQDKSYEEIAVEMNISIESARTNIYRSLKRLRQDLRYE